MAHASGIDPKREQLVLTIALAITMAAARPLSRTPEGMALVAAIIGVASAVVGLRAAYVFDTPAGPSIVCVAAVVFTVSSALKGLRPSA